MAIVNAAKKLKFERFILPGERVKPTRKLKGLKKGKRYKVLCYVPDRVLLKSKGGINKWYKTKHLKLA